VRESQDYKTNEMVLAEIRCDQALDLLDAGNPAKAAEIFRECLAVDPTMLDAMHGLLRALQNIGRLDEAIKIACRLIALGPDDVLAHDSLSSLYLRKGMIHEAEAAAARARLLDEPQSQQV
jgi:tetratricopeptide (TPR) repeat protein